MSERPFKKFFCDRDEIFLIPLPAVKIWLYHYKCEQGDRRSWPSIETISKKCDLNRKTVMRYRQWLVDNGWLKQIGIRKASKGPFGLPIFQVTRGIIGPSGGPIENGIGPFEGDYRSVSVPLIGPFGGTRSRSIEVDKKEVDEENMSVMKKFSVICERAGARPDFKSSSAWQTLDILCQGQGTAAIERQFAEWLEENPDVENSPVAAFLGSYKRVRVSEGVKPHPASHDAIQRILGLCASQGYALSGKQRAELTKSFDESENVADVPFEIWVAGIDHLLKGLDSSNSFEVNQIPSKIANSLVPLVLHDPKKSVINAYYEAKAVPFVMAYLDDMESRKASELIQSIEQGPEEIIELPRPN